MALTFVDVNGDVLPDPVALKQYQKATPRPKPEEKSFHKGWRVMGIPPGALEEARDAHKRLQDMAATLELIARAAEIVGIKPVARVTRGRPCTANRLAKR